jgi:hypothetical protein
MWAVCAELCCAMCCAVRACCIHPSTSPIHQQAPTNAPPRAKAEAQPRAKAKEQARAKAEEQPRAKAEAQPRAIAEEQARAIAEEQARAEAEEQARAEEKMFAHVQRQIHPQVLQLEALQTALAASDAREQQRLKQQAASAVREAKRYEQSEEALMERLFRLGPHFVTEANGGGVPEEIQQQLHDLQGRLAALGLSAETQGGMAQVLAHVNAFTAAQHTLFVHAGPVGGGGGGKARGFETVGRSRCTPQCCCCTRRT